MCTVTALIYTKIDLKNVQIINQNIVTSATVFSIAKHMKDCTFDFIQNMLTFSHIQVL